MSGDWLGVGGVTYHWGYLTSASMCIQIIVNTWKCCTVHTKSMFRYWAFVANFLGHNRTEAVLKHLLLQIVMTEKENVFLRSDCFFLMFAGKSEWTGEAADAGILQCVDWPQERPQQSKIPHSCFTVDLVLNIALWMSCRLP